MALNCGKYGLMGPGDRAAKFQGDSLFDTHGCRIQQLPDSYPALRPFYSSWELAFDATYMMNWSKEHWIMPFGFCVAYLVYIFSTQAIMKSREPFKLKGALQLWNLLLAVFSAIGFLRTAPHLINNFFTLSFEDSICKPAEQSYVMGAAGFWTMLFIFSKVPELIDTVFIVLRKNKLIFLHWYHHVTVLLYCWHSFATRSSAGIVFTAMNFGVHALMYWYYFLSARGVKSAWAPIVTFLQIAQMFAGLFVAMYVAYTKYVARRPCDMTDENLFYCSVMYASYAFLFVAFFLQKYLSKGPSSSSSSAASSKKGASASTGTSKADAPSAAAKIESSEERDPSPSPSAGSSRSEEDPDAPPAAAAAGAVRRRNRQA